MDIFCTLKRTEEGLISFENVTSQRFKLNYFGTVFVPLTFTLPCIHSSVENWSINQLFVSIFFFASFVFWKGPCITGNTRAKKGANHTDCQWQSSICMLNSMHERHTCVLYHYSVMLHLIWWKGDLMMNKSVLLMDREPWTAQLPSLLYVVCPHCFP